MDWAEVLNCALDYMEDHLSEEIRCGEIAAHAHISSFHFQRTFALLTGMTVGEYLRRRRLTLAGQELSSGKVKVIDVALKYGYETPESFTKAFSRFHGVSPIQAKKGIATLKSYQRLVIKIIMEGGSNMDYRMEEKNAFQVVAKVKYFTEENSAKDIPAFWREYHEAEQGEKVPGVFGICFEGKENAAEWRYGIGCEASLVTEIPDGFEQVEIPASTWAIFPCRGPMPAAIQETWKKIYSEWLPQSKYELIPDYDIEYYTDGDNTSEDYLSEIWIPVCKK